MGRFGLFAAGFVAVVVSAPAHADVLNAFSYSAAVQAACATSGPPPGHPSGYLYTVPQAAACPAGTDLHTGTGIAGPVGASSSASVTNAISSFSPPWSANVSSQSVANYGVLGSKATGTLDGATDGFSWRGTETAASFTKTMNLTSGSTTDVAHFAFTVDGTLTWAVHGDGQMLLTSQYTGGFETLGLRLNFGISNQSAYLNGNYVTSAPGLTFLSDGYQANDVQVIVDVPFTSGTAFDLTVLLATAALPGPSPDSLVPASQITSDFFSTATLTGISVSSGTDFTIDCGAGFICDETGIHPLLVAAPEPATLAAFGLGLLGLGTIRRRRTL